MSWPIAMARVIFRFVHGLYRVIHTYMLHFALGCIYKHMCMHYIYIRTILYLYIFIYYTYLPVYFLYYIGRNNLLGCTSKGCKGNGSSEILF